MTKCQSESEVLDWRRPPAPAVSSVEVPAEAGDWAWVPGAERVPTRKDAVRGAAGAILEGGSAEVVQQRGECPGAEVG